MKRQEFRKSKKTRRQLLVLGCQFSVLRSWVGAPALLVSRGGSIMSCMGFSETIFLFFLALLIFGPKKLPEIARQVGKVLNEFKRASNEFKSQIESEISQLDTEQQRQILPPGEPPAGAVAGLAAKPAESGAEAVPEQHSLVKAPDA
jgi:TatA/E family protein of Tat protein translocase